MINQPAGKGAAHNHYYTLAGGKVKVCPTVFHQTGTKQAEKFGFILFVCHGSKRGRDKLHKKGCGFFTEMYGIMSDLYLRINKVSAIIMIEGSVWAYAFPNVRDKPGNNLE